MITPSEVTGLPGTPLSVSDLVAFLSSATASRR